MKKFLSIFALALGLILAPTPALSQAANVVVTGKNLIMPMTLVIDPGVVTTGAAITTGTIDTAAYDSMVCAIQNDAGAARSVIPICVDKLGTTVYTFPTTALGSAATVLLNFDPIATTTSTAPTNGTNYGVNLCRYMKVQAAAAASTGRIACTLRSARR